LYLIIIIISTLNLISFYILYIYFNVIFPFTLKSKIRHGTSWKFYVISFHVTSERQFGQNPHHIPGLLHVIYPSFSLFSMLKQLDKDFGQVQVTESPWNLLENDEISRADLVSLPTKLPWKRHEKVHVTFFTGWFFISQFKFQKSSLSHQLSPTNAPPRLPATHFNTA